MDDRMRGVRFQFHTVCIVISDHISCKFHNGKLHAKTETEKWNFVCAGVFDCFDLSVYTAVSETSRHEDTAYIG